MGHFTYISLRREAAEASAKKVLVSFFKALTGQNTYFFNYLRDINSGISTQSLPLITERE